MDTRRLNNLLASSSITALLLGAAGAAQAVPVCTITQNGGSTGSISNSAAINCILIENNALVSGNVTNTSAGKLTTNGIQINGSTVGGAVINQGSIFGGISVNNNATVAGGISNSGTMGAEISVGTVSTFGGGITNSGTIAGGVAIQVGLVSLFTGGITNIGTLTGFEGIGLGGISSFSGGISNGGAISASLAGILVGFQGATGTTNFSGGIANSGSIIAKSTGIVVVPSTFAGGITNTGTISGGVTGILIQNTPSVSIFDSGTIIGSGGTAIQFGTGTNTMTLGPGWSINGKVLGAGSDNFQLGGMGAGTFNLGLLGTQFTGFGSFATVGGTWDLTGSDAGFTGSTTVSGGDLVVGTAANPNVTLAGPITVTGGILSGHGTILGNVVNSSGTVAPGGTIGTLTVNGNYTQGPGGALSIEVSPGGASKLLVSGTANLAGTLNLVFDPGFYSATSYKIVTAGSVIGTFGSVVPTPFGPFVSYDPTDVILNLGDFSTPVFADVTSALVMNAQQANGIILDRLGQRSSGVGDGQIAALGGMGLGAPAAMQYAQAGNTAAIGDVASALPQALSSQGAWFRGVGGFASVNGNSSAQGFTGTAGGFLAGWDRPVSDTIYLGAAAGYLHGMVDATSTSSGTTDTGRLALYGGGFVGSNLLTATLGYGHDWINTSRGVTGIGAASEGHNANEMTVAGQWSLPVPIQGFAGGTATVTPKAGLQFLYLGESGFTESGVGSFDLTSGERGTESLQPYIQIAAAQQFTTSGGTLFTPELRLGYDRETLAGTRELTVATASGLQFLTTGVAPSKNMVTAGIGASVQAGPALSIYANYDAVLPTGNTTEQTLQAGLRIRF